MAMTLLEEPVGLWKWQPMGLTFNKHAGSFLLVAFCEVFLLH